VTARLGGDPVDRLVQLGDAGLGLDALRRELPLRLRRVMTVDAAFLGTVDPATLLFTAAWPDDALAAAAPGFLANELDGHDVNHFADLVAAPEHARSLDVATCGARAASPRYREVMAPLQLGDELRAARYCDGVCWGVLCLHRERAGSGFSEREVALLRRSVPHLARALRRALVTGPAAGAPAPRPGPGVVLVGTDGRVLAQNREAERWLDVFDGHLAGLPAPVRAVVARLARSGGQARSPEVVVRSRDGGWASVTASVLDGADPPAVAVVLAPAPPNAVRSFLLAAHGLTAAQRRVTERVLRGRSTREIVDELHLSEYTVQEYLRAAFDKVGVDSRRELVAALTGR